jgi:hypothetical protein
MGLLKKVNENRESLAVLDSKDSTYKESSKKKNDVSSLILKLENLDPGIEYSNSLLNELCIFYGAEKASLLMFDPDSKYFLPISSKNIDLTTIRHLRIDLTLINSSTTLFSQIIYPESDTFKSFKQYFSIREFSALESLFFLPFFKKDTLIGFLLLLNPTDLEIETSRFLLSQSTQFILKLLNSRKPFNNKSIDKADEVNLNPKECLQDYITSNNIDGITFIAASLSIKSLLNELIVLLPDFDSYDIANDIIKAIKQLISPTGMLIKQDGHKYLLFYKIKNGKTPGIIFHHINHAISSFFNISKNLPDIEVILNYTQGGPNISADSLLTDIL